MSDRSDVPDDVVALRTQVASLRAANESLRALLEDKDAKIAGLEAQVAAQAERIARLSGWSPVTAGIPMPPSGDDQPGKTPPKPKPKPGKQPGAPGAHLEWNPDPDRTEDLFPDGSCGCGRDLADAEDLGGAVRPPGH